MESHFVKKYLHLFIACGNSIFSADQQDHLQGEYKNKTGNVITALTMWCGYITSVDVEKQHVVHIPTWCLLSYLTSTQSTCSVLYYHVFAVCLYHIFHIISKTKLFFRNGSFEHKLVFYFVYE